MFNDYDAFVRRYCDAKHSNFQKGLDVRGSSNEAELKLLLSGIVMIRRLKEEVASELPNKLREVRYIDPDACYLPELKRLKREGDAIQESLKDPRNDAAILKKVLSSLLQE